jgi:hypothetical protein
MDDTNEQLARFEQMGEEAVRLNLIIGSFNSSNRIVAVKWLAEKVQESERRRAFSQAERMDTARSAKNAAWIAAIAAIIAAIIAIIGAVISYLSW